MRLNTTITSPNHHEHTQRTYSILEKLQLKRKLISFTFTFIPAKKITPVIITHQIANLTNWPDIQTHLNSFPCCFWKPFMNFSFIWDIFSFFLALSTASSSSNDRVPGKMSDVEVLLVLSLKQQKRMIHPPPGETPNETRTCPCRHQHRRRRPPSAQSPSPYPCTGRSLLPTFPLNLACKSWNAC